MANNHAAQHAAQAELDELVEKGELTENGYIRMSNLMKNVVHTDVAGEQSKMIYFLSLVVAKVQAEGKVPDEKVKKIKRGALRQMEKQDEEPMEELAGQQELE